MARLPLSMLLLTLAAGCAVAAVQENPAPSRPNLVVILADDLGWGDLGCYNHPRYKTPNLDRMAQEGVRLTRFYAPVPFCAPSRAALLTGRFPPRCGMTGNPLPLADPAGREELDALGLSPDEVTLAEVLKEAGYATAAYGKWHLGHRPPFLPRRQGFDEYLGVLYSNDMHRVELVENEQVVEYPVVQTTLTQRLTQRAQRFIRDSKEKPFFLYLPQPMPHKPLAPSERFYKKTGTDLYGDTLAELDWSVGEILRTLKDEGLDRRTLVLFTSDNGPWYGGSTGGLRGMKSQTWEGGVRVPFIARWPGAIPPRRVLDGLGQLPDLFATCLAAAKVSAPPRPLDGRSLLPYLQGTSPESPRRYVYSFQGGRLAAVADGRWKLVTSAVPTQTDREWKAGEAYTDPRGPDGVRILAPYEQPHPSAHPGLRTGDAGRDGALFDLQADPGEQRDVSRDHPEVVRRLRAASDWRNPLPSP